MYKSLLALDQVRINFSTSGSHILNVILGLIMFGVALDIRPREFKDVVEKPKVLIGGLLALLLNPKIFPQNLAIGGMLLITAWLEYGI